MAEIDIVHSFVYGAGPTKVVANPDWDASHTFPQGTSFPGSPATGKVYYRTDLHMLFFYDGTRWLSLHQYTATIRRVGTIAEPITTTPVNPGAWPLLEAIWVEDFYVEFFIAAGGTALGASHKWVLTLVKRASDGTTLATIGTINIDSGSSNLWRALSTAVDAASVASDIGLHITATRTGTPGDITTEIARITYRLIAT